MKRNKKLISLICAIAMVFSMLSGLAITANAAGEGLTLNVSEFDTKTNTITVDVGYTGMKTVGYGTFLLELPAGVTNVTANPAAAEGYTDGIYSYTWTYGTSPVTVETADGSGKIATLTLDAENLTSDAEIKFVNSAGELTTIIGDADFVDYELSAGTLANATAVLPHNPSAPETVDTTPAPIATDDPNVTPKPTLAPEVTTEKGFSFGEPKTGADNTITVDVNYEGMSTVGYGTFLIQMPSEVESVTADPKGAELYKDGVYSYTWTYGTSPVSSETGKGKIATLTLKLSKELTEEKQLVFIDKFVNGEDTLQTIIGDADFNDFILGETDGVVASSVNLPYEAPSEDDAYDIGFKDAITKTVEDTPADKTGDGLTAKESEYFIIPTVTVEKDGKEVEATYGDDYVAVIGNTELTKAQYDNLINGHLDADNVKDIVAENNITDINDVVKALSIRTHNNTAKVSAKLVQKSTGVVADSGSATTEEPEAATYKLATLSASPTSKTYTVGDDVTIKFTYDTKDYAKNGKFTFAIAEDLADYITNSGIKAAYKDADGKDVSKVVITDGKEIDIADIVAKGTITLTFKAALKTSKAQDITLTYEGENEEGTTVKAANKDKDLTATSKVSIKNETTTTTSSGGSGSTSSGGGAIANGLVNTTTGALPGIGFSDLSDAEWARDAINALSLRNIVSGYPDGTFNPNGNITRAEYAQILINAIGHQGDSADTYFDDVPTDAWFYHNVAVASQLGIISGYGDGNFGPYDLITREQMALMTDKAAKVMSVSLAGASVGTFSDDADIADWSRDAVYELANAGIINGMGDGTFAPKANATRAQAATIIYNTFIK